MKNLFPAIAVSLLIVPGCTEEDQVAVTPDTVSVAQPDTTHESVEELTELHGLTEEQVIAILGEPDYTDVLTLQAGSTLPEFYIEVHNTYQPDDPATEGVEIRDLEWFFQGYSKAVFLHRVDDRWIVLESVRWEEGVEF